MSKEHDAAVIEAALAMAKCGDCYSRPFPWKEAEALCVAVDARETALAAAKPHCPSIQDGCTSPYICRAEGKCYRMACGNP